MSSLSDKELEQAATEAGLSLGELKDALARRESGDVVDKEVKLPTTKADGKVEARFAMQPSLALNHLHRVFNQQVDYVPSRGRDGQISYVSERMGIAYRLHSESDGSPTGALVRVDIDVSPRLRTYKRRVFPMVALIAALGLISGGFSLSWYVVLGFISLFSVFQIKTQVLKFAEATAQAALARANQAALHGASRYEPGTHKTGR